jgi:hypothetical protein
VGVFDHITAQKSGYNKKLSEHSYAALSTPCYEGLPGLIIRSQLPRVVSDSHCPPSSGIGRRCGSTCFDWLQTVQFRARMSAAAEMRHSGTAAVADRYTHKPVIHAQLWG